MHNHHMDHNDEVNLLMELKSGNASAFEKIYHAYSGRIYLNILKMVKSENDASEILQDVFYKVWTKRDLINPEMPFKSYLYQIAKHTVYNYIRKTNLQKQLQDYISMHAEDRYSHIEEELIYRENKAWLQQTLELLPPQRRQIFKLCKIEGKSYAEVSEMLGISTSTINDHIVKATKFIKTKHFESGEGLIWLAIMLLFDNI